MLEVETAGVVKVGVKRKLAEAALYDDSYHQERQAILNVSMYKLKSFSAARAEPSLLRSVLIYNTLKYIEHELNNEGLTVPNLATPPSLTIQNGDTLDPIPASADAQDGIQKLDIRSSPRPDRYYHSIKPSPIQHNQCDDVTMRYHGNTWSDPPSLTQLQPPSVKLPKLSAHVDFNSNSTTLCPRERSADFTSHHYHHQPGLQSSHQPGIQPGHPPSLLPGHPPLPAPGGPPSHAPPPSAGPPGAPPCQPPPGKTVDDLFGDIDIDLALYDFDLLSPVCQKLPPISADELVHVIPQFGAGDYYPPVAGASCKTDVICDDLDHIMQVLVGM